MLKFPIPSIDAQRAYIDHDIRHILRWAHEIHATLTRTQARAAREAAAQTEAAIKRTKGAELVARADAHAALMRIGQREYKPIVESITRTRDLMPFILSPYERDLLTTPPTTWREATTAQAWELARIYHHDTADDATRAAIAASVTTTRDTLRAMKRDGRPDGFLLWRNGGGIDAAARILQAWRDYRANATRAELIAADMRRLIQVKHDLIDIARRAEGLNLSYGDNIAVSAHDAREAERGRITPHAKAFLYFYLIALKKAKRYAAKRASRTFSDAADVLDLFEKADDAAKCTHDGGELCFMCRHAQEERIKHRIEAASRQHLNAAILDSATTRAEALRAQIIARWC